MNIKRTIKINILYLVTNKEINQFKKISEYEAQDES